MRARTEKKREETEGAVESGEKERSPSVRSPGAGGGSNSAW